MRPLGCNGVNQVRDIASEELVGVAVQSNGGESGAVENKKL